MHENINTYQDIRRSTTLTDSLLGREIQPLSSAFINRAGAYAFREIARLRPAKDFIRR